jgi:hypothetical protein
MKLPRFLIPLAILSSWAIYCQPAVDPSLVLQVASDHADYVLGQPVVLTFRLSPSSAPVQVPNRLSVEQGNIAVLISSGSGYSEYRGPGWGVKTAIQKTVTLAQGQAIEAQVIILINMIAAPGQGGAAGTGIGYLFPQAGAFLMKGVYRSPASGAETESAPISVVIHDPVASDQPVWNVLRADPRLGYLIQTGVLPGYMSSADEDAVVQTLKNLLQLYPTSVYQPWIATALDQLSKFLAIQRSN